MGRCARPTWERRFSLRLHCSNSRGSARSSDAQALARPRAENYTRTMFDELATVLAQDARIRYALVFGSTARGSAHAHSDLDIAIGGLDAPLGVDEIGELIGRLESASDRPVDLLFLDEAPPALAYRVFRDGVVILDRDHAALVDRKKWAILEYLDWKPLEEILTRGALEAAKRGR